MADAISRSNLSVLSKVLTAAAISRVTFSPRIRRDAWAIAVSAIVTCVRVSSERTDSKGAWAA
jgi:hypothetical protein